MGLFLPQIDYSLCTNCSLCYRVCAGVNLSKGITAKLNAMDDPFVGNVLQALVGRANDSFIFNNAQSGGLVTIVLAYLMETGKIDGAVVVRADEDNIPYVKPFIAKTKQDLIQAQKSKYVPVNLMSIFSEIEAFEGDIALVGLPCHVHALMNLTERKKSIAPKIKYLLGLICGGVMTYKATELLFEKSRVPRNEIKNIIFRDKLNNNYLDAKVSVVSIDARKHTIPREVRFELKKYFTPPRCKFCFDKLNIFSDITFGDPWGIEGIDNARGDSLILVRNDKGSELIEHLIDADKISMRKINLADALTGQNIRGKRLDYIGFRNAYRKTNLGETNYKVVFNNKIQKINDEKSSEYVSYVKRFIYLNRLPHEKVKKLIKRKLIYSDSLRKVKFIIKKMLPWSKL